MLNIVSKSIISSHTRGPRKVVANVLKGLDELGYPYVINAALDATDLLWIHDDKDALLKAVSLPHAPAIIAGPNIYTLPSEIPNAVLEKNIPLMQPAPWVESFWQTFSTRKIRTVVWSAGIDTKAFTPHSDTQKDLVLVYNKQRQPSDIKLVCEALEARKENYEVLTYGKYDEAEYLQLLKRTKALVWVGRSESQGIGLLEALAMDVPVLLWDITKLGDFVGAEHSVFNQAQLDFSSVTAAPYFDERCGQRFFKPEELEVSLDNFLAHLSIFTPRHYVEEELSLAKQATALLDLFKIEYGKTEQDLKDTTLRSTKKWKNGTFCFTLRTRLKDAVRAIMR